MKTKPNEVTLAAFEEGEQMLRDPNAPRFSSVDELFADMLERGLAQVRAGHGIVKSMDELTAMEGEENT